MGFERTYRLKCDGCGKRHNWPEPNANHGAPHSTPRRARAAAKKDGWQRRKVVVGQKYEPHWIPELLAQNIWQTDGTYHWGDDILRGRDFCPKCVDSMEQEPVTP